MGPATPSRFADPSRCPQCDAPLTGQVCAVCGLALVGPQAHELFRVNVALDDLLRERQQLIARLRAATPLVPAGARTPNPFASPGPADRPEPATATTAATPPPLVPPPARSRRSISVQTVLLGLGALLLSVAALTFLAYSWSVLGLTGRSLILAGLTVAVFVGAGVTQRRRLGTTAESLGWFGVVLVLLDAVAVRATGLAGTGVSGLAYAALVSALSGVGLFVLGRWLPVRAATMSGVGLTLIAPALLGFANQGPVAAGRSIQDGPWVSALGLCGSAVLGLSSPVLRRIGLAAEAQLARLLGLTGLVLAAGFGVVQMPLGPGPAAAVFLGVTAIVLAYSQVTPTGTGAGYGRAAGLSLILATVGTSAELFGWSDTALPVSIMTSLIGVSALIVAAPAFAAADQSARAQGRHRSAVASGVGAAILVAPVLLVLGAVLSVPGNIGAALELMADPWSLPAGITWSGALDRLPGFIAREDQYRTQWLGCLIVGAGTFGFLAHRLRTHGLSLIASGASAALVLTLPWQPGLPMWGVIGVAVAAGAGAGIGAHRLARRLLGTVPTAILIIAAATVFTLGVMLAWTVRPLSVSVTLLGVSALLAARLAAPSYWFVQTPALVLSLSAAVAGGLHQWGASTDRSMWISGMALGLAAVAAASLLRLGEVRKLPGADDRSRAVAPSGPYERWLLAGLGALGVAVAAERVALVAAGALTRSLAGLLVSLVALASLVLVAADPAGRWEPRARTVAVGGSVLACAASAVLLSSFLGESIPGYDLPSGLVIALVQACAILTVASMRWRGAPERPSSVAVQAAAGVLGVISIWVNLEQDLLWLTLLIQAIAVAVLSLVPGRTWLAWVALVLGTASIWERLSANDIGTPEWFTLPPAVVALTAGVLAARRDRRVIRPSVVVGVALLVLPTVTLASSGDSWRAGLIAVGSVLTAAVAVALARMREHHTDLSAIRPRRDLSMLLGLTAAIAVLGGPMVRAAVHALQNADPSQVETWSLAGAGTLGILAVWLLGIRGDVPVAPGHARLLLPGVLIVVTLPTMAASVTSYTLVRSLTLLVIFGAVLVADAWPGALPGRLSSPSAHQPAPIAVVSAAGLVLSASVGATVLVSESGSGVGFELLVLPMAAVLIVVGAIWMRWTPELTSWTWVGAGVAAALLPSLLVASVAGPTWRVVLVGVLAFGVLLAGVMLRWQSPVVLGGAVLLCHAVVQLAPWIAMIAAAAPRWMVFGAIGATLLGLGARYERRVRDVNAIRQRVADLR